MTVNEHAIKDAALRHGAAPAMNGLGSSVRHFWQLSARVIEAKGVRGLRGRFDFVLKAMTLRDMLRPFTAPAAGGSLQRALEKRPELIGAVVWPYICATWDVTKRLRCIEEHFKIIDSIGRPLDFPIDQSIELLDLADVQESLRVVLDQPRWFMREGQFVLNLFAVDVRIYSIAFSFAFESGLTVAYIGAIQGGNIDGVMGDYKDLTKTLHGMRPRDFLVELLRTFCRTVGVTKIYAVADASRQHRSSYFGVSKADVLAVNYDDIWTERGGTRDSEEFFSLSLDAPLKPLEEVASKKRAMYRRRYELLESLEARIAIACAGVRAPAISEPTSSPGCETAGSDELHAPGSAT